MVHAASYGAIRQSADKQAPTHGRRPTTEQNLATAGAVGTGLLQTEMHDVPMEEEERGIGEGDLWRVYWYSRCMYMPHMSQVVDYLILTNST